MFFISDSQRIRRASRRLFFGSSGTSRGTPSWAFAPLPLPGFGMIFEPSPGCWATARAAAARTSVADERKKRVAIMIHPKEGGLWAGTRRVFRQRDFDRLPALRRGGRAEVRLVQIAIGFEARQTPFDRAAVGFLETQSLRRQLLRVEDELSRGKLALVLEQLRRQLDVDRVGIGLGNLHLVALLDLGGTLAQRQREQVVVDRRGINRRQLVHDDFLELRPVFVEVLTRGDH